eukprot:scaffold2828_cov44-Skeletonema_dohrnii-CCMP3373.AAC.1
MDGSKDGSVDGCKDTDGSKDGSFDGCKDTDGSKEGSRTGWVSQLASRQNMLWADSYAGVVSVARVTSKRC